MGFSTPDCVAALKHCDNRIDDAALWLTQNAVSFSNRRADSEEFLKINTIEVLV